jgi:chromosome segregation ATPase
MPNRVINFKRDEWHTRDKLAELLDISVRTLYRRIDDGEIEVKDTPDGKRYRVTAEPREEEVATDATGVPDVKIDTPDTLRDTNAAGDNVAGELIGLIREQLGEVTELRPSRGRLEAELESSQNDVTRAVDYVTQLEEELDRLDEERVQLAENLQEERGRRLEIEEQFDQLRAELNLMVGVRAKYHLERGRREQAEQKTEDLRDEMVALHRELEKLTHKLDDEEQRRLKLALGSLSLEVRRGSPDES